MRILYLCKADPPPPDSDWMTVIEYFKDMPPNLQFILSDVRSEHIMLFADRQVIDEPTLSLFDTSVVFISQRYLNDKECLNNLKNVCHKYPDTMCIDLYSNLTPELMEIVHKYTSNIFTADEGKEVLIRTFPDVELRKSIETEGYNYLDDTIDSLKNRAKSNKRIAFFCYFGSFIFLFAILAFTVYRYFFNQTSTSLDTQTLVVLCVELVTLSALTVSLSRFLFLLGKSFMVESIRYLDRAHAIGLGKLYLQLFKNRFKWNELKDVLQNWNIDKGSAFINLDAKDIEAIGFEKVISAIKGEK